MTMLDLDLDDARASPQTTPGNPAGAKAKPWPAPKRAKPTAQMLHEHRQLVLRSLNCCEWAMVAYHARACADIYAGLSVDVQMALTDEYPNPPSLTGDWSTAEWIGYMVWNVLWRDGQAKWLPCRMEDCPPHSSLFDANTGSTT